MLLLAFVIGCIVYSVQPKTPEGRAARDASNAWYIAQDFVSRSLKAPSTADFSSRYDTTSGVHRMKTGSYQTWGTVDAQNGFGANLRQEWMAVVTSTDDGKWTCEWLQIGKREIGKRPQSFE